MTTTDLNVEVARLQQEIAEQLGLDPNNVVFNYKQKDEIVRLDLITINPKHDQSFLYHQERGIDKVEALRKMRDYVFKQHQEDNVYTLQWTKFGDDEYHTSYFRGKNVYEILDKFYYGRDQASYKIFSITLNPVT